MAWNTHYIVPFKSFDGNDLEVRILEQNYTGSTVTLTGSDEPFTTQEDDDEDVFAPIRTQSGYLRVIDYDGTLLEQLIPSNNTERLVVLMQTTNGTETLRWRGFLQAQAYTQPWLDGATEIELPVKSELGALEDVAIDSDYTQVYKNFAWLIVQAYTSLNLAPSSVYIGSDAQDAANMLMACFNLYLFFQKEEIVNEGITEDISVGKNFSEVLTEAMKLYGLCMREEGGALYLMQYDTTGTLRLRNFTWTQIRNAANGTTPTTTAGAVSQAAMMSALIFKKNDSENGYNGGGRTVKVELDVETENIEMLELPKTEEDATTPLEIHVANGNDVVIQCHNPRSNDYETFQYWKSTEDLQNESLMELIVYISFWNAVASTYSALWHNLMLRNNRFSTDITNLPEGDNDVDFYTGAIPVRWGQKGDGGSARLSNGLLLVQEACNDTSQYSHLTDKDMYTIKTLYPVQLEDGYININLRLDNFYNLQPHGLDADFGGHSDNNGFRVKLKVGNQWWNGSAWTTTESFFQITMEGAQVESNKSQEMNVDSEQGWFVPITSAMTGVVEFTILNSVNDTTSMINNAMQTVHKILSNLEVKYLHPANILASSRSKNVYRQELLVSGFKDEKTIDLSVGTFNNNLNSSTFIRNANNDYIESMTYLTANSGTVSDRPETRLLSRMAAQYSTVRRTLSATVQRGLELMHTLYTKDGKTYFGIKAQTNWRDDTEQVKFLEVAQPT